jgi:hypothetical protein
MFWPRVPMSSGLIDIVSRRVPQTGGASLFFSPISPQLIGFKIKMNNAKKDKEPFELPHGSLLPLGISVK